VGTTVRRPCVDVGRDVGRTVRLGDACV